MKGTLFNSLLGIIAFMVATTANATTTFDVQGAGSSVNVANVSLPGGIGISPPTATLDAALDAVMFNLEVGESATFDFFEIGLDGGCLCGGELTADFIAHLVFSSPGGSASSTGDVSLGYGLALLGGSLVWQGQPQLVDLGDTTFSVSLNDITGNILDVPDLTVMATVTLLSEPVPEPATLAMLGLALAGLSVSRRRRRH